MVNISDGQRINVALTLTEEGRENWLEMARFFSELKHKERISDANAELIKGFAQKMRQSGVRIDTDDDFQDVQEELRFEGQQTVAHKRAVRLSAIGKIYDTTSGKLLESANFQLEEKEGVKLQQGVFRDGARADQLLTEMAREMAHRIANRTGGVVFPAKIMAKTGKLVTINRGDGTGIQNGQEWTIFAVGEELIDPDTRGKRVAH
jgi:hypothetical protein